MHLVGAELEVWCRGKWRECIILERRGPAKGQGESSCQYYIHFPGWDRRMDTWASPEELRHRRGANDAPAASDGASVGAGGHGYT